MAKNYTFNEAVKIIAKGTDMEAITDIGRRYPVLAHKIAVVTAKAGEEFVDLMGYMPEYLTANKVNTAIKAGITESGSDEDDTEDEATEVATEDADDVTDDYDSMNATEIWKLMCERGLDKTVKSKKKGDRIAALREYDKNGGNANSDSEDDEDAEAEDDATEANPYEGKSAMELFKECKARKIKAAPKKPAKFYADLLIKDDAAKAEATEAESEEDDDWGDEEVEAPKKEDKKAAPKASAKGGKAKAAKKAEAESEDDEDWDI